MFFEGNVTHIAAGVVHSCAITAEKRLLVWGNNRQAQLGYDKKLKEAYRPILFGGLLEAKRISPGLDTTPNQDKTIHDFGLNINYLSVKCGSAMTVAQIDKSPFLLIWGYNSHKAWGFPNLFDRDQPVLFQAVGSILFVLTKNRNFYRINAEQRTHEQITEIAVAGFEEVMEQGGLVHNMACGSDFILATNSAGNVYSKGANKYG